MSTYTSLYGVPSHVAPEIPTATTGHVPVSYTHLTLPTTPYV